MKKGKHGWVVDEDGQVIIHAGNVGPELIKADDKSSHVVISYWNDFEENLTGKPMTVKIFPLNRVYYRYLEE